jgi:drug/metabolite transporter (DMT)-like permease
VSSPRDGLRVHAALTAVQILFGLWPVAGAAVLRLITPPALIGFRLLLGAPLLALLSGIAWRKLPSRSDLVKLALLGAAGVSVNQLLFAEGLARAGPINASLSILLMPALTLTIATLARLERPGAARLVGVGLSFLGGALLLRVERFDFSDRVAVGNLFLFCNITAYSVYVVGARPVLARLGSLRTIGWVFVFGALEAAPITLPAVVSTPWPALPGWAIGSLAFILFGATLATYLLNAYALKRVESSLVAVYVYVQPVIAVTAAWLWLGTRPTLRTWVAAAVIVAGVALATRRGAKIGQPDTRKHQV